MNDEQMTLTRVEQLLEENLELAEENNKLLHDLRRTARLGFWFKLLVWAAVIILPFILLKPILETLIPAARTGEGGVGVFGLPSQEQLENVIDTYQGGQ